MSRPVTRSSKRAPNTTGTLAGATADLLSTHHREGESAKIVLPTEHAAPPSAAAPFAYSGQNSGWGAAAQGNGTLTSYLAIAISGPETPWAATAAALPMRHDRADSEHSSLDAQEAWPILGTLQPAAKERRSFHCEASGGELSPQNVAVPQRRRRRPLSMRNNCAPQVANNTSPVAEKSLAPGHASSKRFKSKGLDDTCVVPSTSCSRRCTFEWEAYDFGGVACDVAPEEQHLDESMLDHAGGQEAKSTDIFDFENW
jgi:hypothetical protein